MKILYISSEVAPFIKTGGLADVAGSLPQAIKEAGHDIRVVLPYYSKIKDKNIEGIKFELDYYVDLGWRRQYAGIYSLEKEGVIYYFIDNDYYFKRYNIYGEYDDGERFIFFQKAAVLMLKKLRFKANIVNCNDWHSGLVPLYIRDFAKGDPYYSNINTVFTIHNIRYQGIFPAHILEEIGGLSSKYITDDGLKYYDEINFMKAGIVYSDIFTTVSKTYAEEIKTSEYGEGLENTNRIHENKLYGIVNGIDYNIFNPETDSNLKENYSFETIEDKKLNKLELQRLYNLPEKSNIPMIAMVTRLVDMKGLDLIKSIMEELLKEDIQFVLLGTGDKMYEDMFKYYEEKYPDKVASRNYFNEGESHLIYAGADIFLMPSLSEPCGISQLISLRYGTIPIVRETGGLKDTIIPFNEEDGTGNGFTFKSKDPYDLLDAIKRTLNAFKDKEKWNIIIKNAMEAKHDWEKSSQEYIVVYKKLTS
ncbi:glycogen synthase GlgA [Tissierella sp. Yu-01]|uniref:glycogen synthase GlgA n=1 Tax=Tissierella sp. Yu-01 TaxID=3035694 RepID=UPI00240E12CB|nr:glycogen synthase GlgA [Tissierella sp. Yu-01]WFA08498.1 glycogen synthase GlgA [Tissierella sp. Yu-01]